MSGLPDQLAEVVGSGLEAPRSRWRRAGRDVFIVMFLVVQLLLPWRYYLSDDPYDERFAWRMFSPTRMTSCHVAFFEGGDSVPPSRVQLQRQVHIVWIELMARARTEVILAWARHRCEALRELYSSPSVRVELRCEGPEGAARDLFDPYLNLCQVIDRSP